MTEIQNLQAMGAQRMTSLEIAEITGKLMNQGIRHLLVTDQDVMHEAERIVGRELTSDNRHADGCITVTDIAKVLGMETKALNSFLKNRGVQRWRRGQYRLTENYEGRGLAQDRLFVYYGKDGKTKRSTYLVWTTKGAEMIEEMVNQTKEQIEDIVTD